MPRITTSCVEFLESYSDYRDGLLADPTLRRRLERHLRTCPTCMRYHARLARGVTVLRTFSDLEPSRTFSQASLQRIEPEEEAPVTPGRPSVMVGLMVAAALALFFWGGDQPVETTPVVATSPSAPPAIVANAGVPFVSFADLSIQAFAPTSRAPGASDETLFTLAATTR